MWEAYAALALALMCALCVFAGMMLERWRQEDPSFPEQTQKRVQANAPKAWRFVAEMEEISKTFSEAGLPGGFHASAADIYKRLARFKDSNAPPTPEEILAALTEVP